MNSPRSTLPASSGDLPSPFPGRSEVIFLGGIYLITVVGGSLTIAVCGPGCCYIFFSILAAVSGLLMLRQLFASRVFCLAMLLLSLVGMWREKEARDTWEQRVLHLQIQSLQKHLEEVQPK
jgi:hypothetical protein